MSTSNSSNSNRERASTGTGKQFVTREWLVEKEAATLLLYLLQSVAQRRVVVLLYKHIYSYDHRSSVLAVVVSAVEQVASSAASVEVQSVEECAEPWQTFTYSAASESHGWRITTGHDKHCLFFSFSLLCRL